jgi:hypothetical protein
MASRSCDGALRHRRHYTDVGPSTPNAHTINRKHLIRAGNRPALWRAQLLERHGAHVPWHEIGARPGLPVNDALDDAAAMRITRRWICMSFRFQLPASSWQPGARKWERYQGSRKPEAGAGSRKLEAGS